MNYAQFGLMVPFEKYNFIKRRFQEQAYGRAVAEVIKAEKPDVLISANTPPDAQAPIYQASRLIKCRFVSWVHDIHALAIKAVLAQKLPLIGDAIAWFYLQKEKKIIQNSDAVVVITEAFQDLTDQWGISRDKVFVIPNWAPIVDIPVRPKSNAWAKAHNLTDKFCFLYAGTLGLKHNPELLLALAQHFQGDSQVRVVVASEGLGADYLREQKELAQVDNLDLLGFQALADFPDMLGTGDVLLAILTPEAGQYSVPSKILSYLCAQRALLLALPPDNLAAKIVQTHKAGLLVQANDQQAFIKAAKKLYEAQDLLQTYGKNGRQYAENHFHIAQIGDQFEHIFKRD